MCVLHHGIKLTRVADLKASALFPFSKCKFHKPLVALQFSRLPSSPRGEATAGSRANAHSNSHFSMSLIGNNTMAVFVQKQKHVQSIVP